MPFTEKRCGERVTQEYLIGCIETKCNQSEMGTKLYVSKNPADFQHSALHFSFLYTALDFKPTASDYNIADVERVSPSFNPL